VAEYSRKNRGLETAYPPSGLDKHEPARLSEDVQLVQDFLGALLRIGNRERKFFTIDAAPGVAVVNAFTGVGGPGAIPENTVRHVEWISFSHDDPVARQLGVNLFNTNIPGSVTGLGASLFDAAGAAVAQNTIWPVRLGRPLLCGPGDEVQGFGAVAAGQVLRVRYCMIDYSPAETVV